MDIKYSEGNRKIGTDTMIINMESAKHCSSGKAGLCPLYTNGKCYAMKAERLYPQVLPYRYKQKMIWKYTSAESIANQIIERNNRKRKKLRYLRINEAGDIATQSDLEKLSLIADILSWHNIKVYTYTHNSKLDFSNVSDNLTINGSDFMVHNEFKAVKDYKGRIRCPGNCRTCNICMESRGVVIECKIH